MEEIRRLFEGIDLTDLVRRHVESLPLDQPLRQAIFQRVQGLNVEAPLQQAIGSLQIQDIAAKGIDAFLRKLSLDMQAKLAVERRIASLSLKDYIQIEGVDEKVREHISQAISHEDIQRIVETFPVEPLFVRENPRVLLESAIQDHVRKQSCTEILQSAMDAHVASFPLEETLHSHVDAHIKTLPIPEKLAMAVQQSKAHFLDHLKTYVTPELVRPILQECVDEKLTTEMIRNAIVSALKDRIHAEAEAVSSLLRRDAESLIRQELGKVSIRDMIREEIREAIRQPIADIPYAEIVNQTLREEGRLDEKIQSQLTPLLGSLTQETKRKLEERVLSVPLDTLVEHKVASFVNPTLVEVKLEDTLRAIEPRKQFDLASRRVIGELVDRAAVEDAVNKIVAGYDVRGLVRDRIEIQSAVPVQTSSVGLFIKSCSRDGAKLVRCLKSIQQFAEGFAGVCVVTDADDTNVYDGLINRFPFSVKKTAYPAQAKTTCPHGIGFIWMQHVKLNWFTFCNFDIAALLDADAVLTSKLTPDMLMNSNGLWKWGMAAWDSASQSYKAGQDLLLPSEYAHVGSPLRVLTRTSTLAFHKWMRDTHAMSWWDFLITKPTYVWKQGLWGSQPYNAFGAFLTQVYKQDYEFTAYKPLPVQNV
jgi:hypothetical protein